MSLILKLHFMFYFINLILMQKILKFFIHLKERT